MAVNLLTKGKFDCTISMECFLPVVQAPRNPMTFV